MKRKVLITILLIIATISTFLLYKSSTNKEIVLDDVILKDEIIKDKSFAIMLEDSRGSGTYTKTNTKTFPTTGYTFNNVKSGCMDSDGYKIENALSYDDVNHKVLLTINKSSTCYMYFDKDAAINVQVVNLNDTYNTRTLKYADGSNVSNAYYNTKYNALVINNVSDSSTYYKLTYSNEDLANQGKVKLSDTIIGLVTNKPGNDNCTSTEGVCATSGNGKIVNESSFLHSDYTNSIAINESGYTNWISPFYNDSFDATAVNGTEESTAISTFDSTNNYYQTNPTVNDKYYNYIFQVSEAGVYQFCYKISSGSGYNNLYLYKGTDNMYYEEYVSANSSSEKCYRFGYINTTDKIRIIQHTNKSVASLNIYLKKGEVTTLNLGYRYKGKNPNNYIWFNNEIWRIIGIVPICLDSNCTTKKNLAKIIKNDSLGSYTYNTSWGTSNKIYTILNNYYINEDNLDGTNDNNCISNGWDCDFTVKGIGANPYYKNMVEEVYWYNGEYKKTDTISEAYLKEISSKSKTKVGIMNVTDYGLATDNHIIPLNYLGRSVSTNWLYKYGFENVISNSIGCVKLNGDVDTSGVVDYLTRPVVYLKDAIYVISGNGSETNPYQIAMN